MNLNPAVRRINGYDVTIEHDVGLAGKPHARLHMQGWFGKGNFPPVQVEGGKGAVYFHRVVPLDVDLGLVAVSLDRPLLADWCC